MRFDRLEELQTTDTDVHKFTQTNLWSCELSARNT